MGRRSAFGQIAKLPSGRYRARYVGPDGVRYSAPGGTFYPRKAAEDWLVAEGNLVATGAWVPPAQRVAAVVRPRDARTFREFADDWLEGRAETLAPRTVDHYRSTLRLHIYPTFGSKRLADITADDVERWYRRTLKDRPTYRAQVYVLFRQVMTRAVKRKLIEENPVDIENASGTAPGKRSLRRLPTRHDIEVIAKAMPDEWQALVLLAAWSGLRYGELTELRRGDVVLRQDPVTERWEGYLLVERAVVTVKRAEGPNHKAPADRRVGDPKSDAGERQVWLPSPVCAQLHEHLERHVGPKANALLFHGVQDPEAHLPQSTIWRHYDRARTAAGWPKLHLHDLRHVAGTRAAQAGATLAELQAYLGHSTTIAAMRYQEAVDERMKGLAEAIEHL